jgi:phospholipid/cholesterol/gamma-HCH transport system substrate-binding protein
MQFGERNPVIIGLVALGLLVGLTVGALTLQRSDFVGGYRLVAEFADANGLRVDDIVTIAGVQVGRVEDIQIVNDHVEATLEIEGAEVPVGTTAELAPQTLVGKRAVELATGDDFAQLLADGDRIPIERTFVSIDVPRFGNASQDLLSEVDSEALNTFIRSLTDLTRGQRDEVAGLINGGTRLTTLVNDQEEEIRELLRELRGLSETLNSRDDELLSIIDDFDIVLEDLLAKQEDIRALFRETTATNTVTADLIAAKRGEIDRVLDEVHLDLEIVNRHQMDLAEALAYAPEAVGGFASISFAGETKVPWGQVFVQSLGPAGIDPLLGCGGLVDRQLDLVLGPDPRSCEQQANDTFPDDTDPQDEESEPPLPLPELPPPGTREARMGIDVFARSLLPPAAEVAP